MKKFGDFLKRSKISIDLDDSLDYKRVTIKIKHGGVSLRDIEIGKKIGTKKQFILKKGQFVLSKIDARYGAFGIAPAEVDNAIITGNFWAYDVDLSMIDIDWFNQYTNSKDFYDVCERASSGITHRKYLSEIQFLNNEVNLPSLQDQKKAVKKINNLKAFGNNLSKEINYQLNLIKDIRQAFLREAMQGKLVSNETSDGKTGADLLAEIQAEKAQLIKEKKIKKPKPLPPISEGEIPFDIPENWTWCRLREITKYSEAGTSFKCQEIPINNQEWGVLKVSAVSWDKFDENANKLYSKLPPEDLRAKVNKNDFLISRANTSELVGKSVIVNKIARNLLLSDKIIRFHFFDQINKSYVNTVNNSYTSRIYYSSKGTGSSPSMKNITREVMENLIIPLPPIEIQERIVAKLDELMDHCDALEEQIKQSQQTNDLLLQQVLREALGEKKGEFTELQLVDEPTEQYITKQFTSKTCDKNDMAVLTGYIIKELNTEDFGRVKLQKMLHLVEYHCQLETNFNYYKKVAGPHAEELKESIESILQRNRFFDIKKEKLGNKEKVNYTALAGVSQIDKFFNSDFKEQKENINFVLHKFRNKTWEFSEMISTMYAVWNNRLIKGEIIDNEELKKDFLAWDPQKIKFLDKLDYSIEWIKKEGLVPTGFGKYIDKQ
ncbi:restriction endonuclease subunit S [Chryseobacterium sp. 22458]|uniref:restriction endonuclease subunit S n=1 Tax=Chryseobacterium sp. 22458 TaxID=3453921 RepID=UPI003F8796E1